MLPGGVAVAADVADWARDAAVAEVEETVGPTTLVAHAPASTPIGLKERLAKHRRALERGEGERGFCGVVDAHRGAVNRSCGSTSTALSSSWGRLAGDDPPPPGRHRRRPRRPPACRATPASPILGLEGRGAAVHPVGRPEVAPYDIRANTIAPGTTATPMFGRTPDGERLVATTPIGPVAGADELAAAFSYLLSDEASYIVGETMNVNGGLVIQ